MIASYGVWFCDSGSGCSPVLFCFQLAECVPYQLGEGHIHLDRQLGVFHFSLLTHYYGNLNLFILGLFHKTTVELRIGLNLTSVLYIFAKVIRF